MANHPVPGSSNEGFEQTDAHAKPLLWFALGLFIMCVLTFVAMALMFKMMDDHTNKTDAGTNVIRDSRWRAPDIQLEVHPSTLRQALNKQEEDLLTTYDWVDKPSGKVRIPIERAIQLTAQKKLPYRKTLAAETEGSAALTESGGSESVVY